MKELLEWRWVDDKGRAMTHWKKGELPPVLDLRDEKGEMHVEMRLCFEAKEPLTPQELAALAGKHMRAGRYEAAREALLAIEHPNPRVHVIVASLLITVAEHQRLAELRKKAAEARND